MNLRPVALTLSLILPGCGGESGRSLAAVYDSAGVRIVENRDVEGDRTSNWTVSPRRYSTWEERLHRRERSCFPS